MKTFDAYTGPTCNIHGPHCGHSDLSCPDNPKREAIEAAARLSRAKELAEKAPDVGVALKFAAMMQGWSELANEAWKKNPESKFSQLLKKWRDTVNVGPRGNGWLPPPAEEFPAGEFKMHGFLRGAETQWDARRPVGLVDAAISELGLETLLKKFGGERGLYDAIGPVRRSARSHFGPVDVGYNLTPQEVNLVLSLDSRARQDELAIKKSGTSG